MDAELKTLLVALTEGQVKLAEGQAKTDVSLGRLYEGQARMEIAIGELAGHVSVLAEGQAKTDAVVRELASHIVRLDEGQVRLDKRMGVMTDTIAHLATATEAALTRLTERIDEFGERVTRGFTNGASTDRKLDDEIHALDARVTKLERKEPGPKKRR